MGKRLASAFFCVPHAPLNTLQTAVCGFALLLLVLIWSATVRIIETEREQSIGSAMQSNANVARLLEEHTLRTLQYADEIALQVRDQYVQAGQKFDLRRFVGNLRNAQDLILGIRVVDERGMLVLSSRQDAVAGLLEDFEMIKAHFDNESGKPAITGPPGSARAGRALVVTRRMRKPDGAFAGLSQVEIDPNYFAAFYAQVDVGRNGIVTLAGLDSKPFMRVADGVVSNRDLGKAELSRKIRTNTSGSYVVESNLDGIRRIYSYRAIRGYPLIINVGVAEDAALSEHAGRARNYYIGAATVSLIIFAVTLWLLVLVRRQLRAATRLKKSEAELRLVADNVPATILYFDENLRCRYINKRFSDIHGLAMQDVSGKHVREIVGEAAYPQIETHFRGVLNGRSATYRRLQQLANGNERHIETQLVPRFSDQGRVEGCYALSRDISEHMRAGKLAAELAAIVENSNDAILTRTLDGTILSWNAGAERMLGYTAADMIGKSVLRTLSPGHAANLARNNESLLRADAAPYESFRMTADGRVIDVLNSFSPIRDESGNIVAVSVISWDISALKRAQSLVVQNEEQLRATFEQAGVGMGLRSVGSPFRWLRVNKTLCEVLGYTQEELLRLSPADLNPPEERDTAAEFSRRMASGEITEYTRERRYLHKNGGIVHVIVSHAVVKGVDGRPRHSISVVQDITERKRMESERERLAAIVDQSSDAIISRTHEGRVVSWNKGAEHMFGYTAEEMIGNSINTIVPSDRATEAQRNREAVLQGQPLPHYESVRLAKDGRRVDVSISTFRVADKRGDAALVATTFRDITPRKRAEAQLRLAAGVFAHAIEGIMITDRNNNIILVNPAFSKITGYTAEEVTGKNPHLLSSGWHKAGFYEGMWAAVAATGSWEGEVWDKRKNGESYCELMSISVIPDEKGHVAQYCAIFIDITQQKIAEAELLRLNAELEFRVSQRTAELERVNKELEAFSYSVSHDLRAPLRAIGGFTRLLCSANKGKLDDKSIAYTQRIEDSVGRMEKLIGDLLNLSRISQQSLRHQDVDMTGLAESELLQLNEWHPGRDVQTVVKPGMRAHADAGLLRILLQNLVGNAWKFTAHASPGRIEIGSEARNGERVFYVRDNGAGFDMRYAEKLFAPFQRLHTREEFEGTGIGLSIVQRIVIKHGGKIWAESRKGQGATFFFTLG